MSDTVTPEPKVYRKENLAPARTPILKRLKQVMDARIKIQVGPGAEELEVDDNGALKKMPPSLCIMEATSYILGWDQQPGHNVDDGPPCTSEEITGLMIELNDDDDFSDRQRAQMKAVIPDIINTAPLVWAIDKSHGCLKQVVDGKITDKCERDSEGKVKYPDKLATNTKDSDYKAAEYTRSKMIKNFVGLKVKGDIPMSHWVDFIRELAAVAKFDTANRETEADMTTPAVEMPERQDLPVDDEVQMTHFEPVEPDKDNKED